MKRKVFYSMVEKDKITGIKKRDGYKLNINGEKFNAFKSKTDGMVYIIDPKSGIALIKYHPDWNGNIPTVLACLKIFKASTSSSLMSSNSNFFISFRIFVIKVKFFNPKKSIFNNPICSK